MCGPAWQSARGDGTRHHAQSADTIRSISSSTVPRPYRKSRSTLYSLCLPLPLPLLPGGGRAVTPPPPPPPGRGPSRLTATRLAPAPVAHSCPSRSASACAVRASSVARPATSSCSCSAIVNDSPSVQAERETARRRSGPAVARARHVSLHCIALPRILWLPDTPAGSHVSAGSGTVLPAAGCVPSVPTLPPGAGALPRTFRSLPATR
jgi:hypothetical protein